ncbi:MAG: hypothetical protein CSA15_12380 [Candidatus Delongbacteria bacterium]|nr:MAG: hypothetical protein CSA15_12380 [Candidatus Delongbacteria bacterium]
MGKILYRFFFFCIVVGFIYLFYVELLSGEFSNSKSDKLKREIEKIEKINSRLDEEILYMRSSIDKLKRNDRFEMIKKVRGLGFKKENETVFKYSIENNNKGN